MDSALRLRLSIMMFLQYFIWGAWGVVFFNFIGQLPTKGGLAFPGSYQGWIGATLPIGAMISPIFIGLFADRFFSTEKVLVVLHLVGAGLLAWAAWTCDQNLTLVKAAFAEAAHEESVQTGEGVAQPDLEKLTENPRVTETVRTAYLSLFWILLAYAICYMPTITLTNTLSFRNLSDPDKYFGSIRVLGTIGWIAAGQVVDFALNGLSTQPLYLAAGASVLLGLFCFTLPHTPPAGGAKTLGDTIGLPALAMLKDSSFLVFFFSSFLITIVLAFYFLLGNRFLDDLHTPYPTAVQTIGQVSEIVFMVLIPVGLRWVGTKGMLLMGMLAWCLRYAIFATLYRPAIIGLGLPLHGICYDFFFVVSYLYVDRRAPQHLRASAQGMIAFVTLGVGFFLGNLLAGEVLAYYKVEGDTDWWKNVWLVPLGGSLVASVLFAVLFRQPAHSDQASRAA